MGLGLSIRGLHAGAETEAGLLRAAAAVARPGDRLGQLGPQRSDTRASPDPVTPPGQGPPAALSPPPRNTHTHTVNSDGDSTPDEVVRWYREHGYNFLVLTDHNYLTGVDGLNAVHGAADKFMVVAGEEVTSTASSKAVHVNGLDVDSLVKQSTSPSVVVAAQENVDGIRRANGSRTSTIRTLPGR